MIGNAGLLFARDDEDILRRNQEGRRGHGEGVSAVRTLDISPVSCFDGENGACCCDVLLVGNGGRNAEIAAYADPKMACLQSEISTSMVCATPSNEVTSIPGEEYGQGRVGRAHYFFSAGLPRV